MIVPPKKYTNTNGGGYLLNDVAFSEGLFIEKKAYSMNSELSEKNFVYKMINNLSSTPFKINTALLDYITKNNNKFNLLLDSSVEHEYANMSKRTKIQDNIYKSYNSKVILQETILEIVNFFRKFSMIYFPVRLDQRGRLYCVSNYFNYQSNELSKALLLFAKPGIIKRNDTVSIDYMKAYGANCFGGAISKKSTDQKIK